MNRLGGLRFSLRTVLWVTLVVGLACGWLSTVWRQRQHRAQAAMLSAGSSAFQRASFEKGRLRGAVFAGNDSTFQEARFDSADLAGATLTAGGSAFQGASFVQADLAGTKLTGRGSTFQRASLAGADLSGAELCADDTAFQGASLNGAKLIGAKLQTRGIVAFQSATIDSAHFQSADLIQLDPSTLAGWTFQSPPHYDDQTRFPAGFDPVAQGWKRAAK